MFGKFRITLCNVNPNDVTHDKHKEIPYVRIAPGGSTNLFLKYHRPIQCRWIKINNVPEVK